MADKPSVIEAPGIYEMPEDDYFADPVLAGSLSCTWAKQLAQPGGPAKWKWEREHPKPSKKHFDLGHAAHALVLGVGAPIEKIPFDEWRTKAAKDLVADAREAGYIPLKPAEFEQVTLMAEQIRSHELAMSLIEGARHEQSAFRVDTDTGLWLRCRFDSISPDGISDYKTTICAEPTEFVRQAVKLGFHQQAAWYRDMAQALGITDGPFRFIAQEKQPPYLVAVIDLERDTEDLGRRTNRRAIDIYSQCRATGQWPGYPPIIHTVSAPPWAFETPDTLDPDVEQELVDLLKGTTA